jgi:hypothetical protein
MSVALLLPDSLGSIWDMMLHRVTCSMHKRRNVPAFCCSRGALPIVFVVGRCSAAAAKAKDELCIRIRLLSLSITGRRECWRQAATRSSRALRQRVMPCEDIG